MQDIKSKVKEKLALFRKHAAQTGGGSPSKIKFTEADETVIRVFNCNTVDGEQNLREMGRRLNPPPSTLTTLLPSASQNIVTSPNTIAHTQTSISHHPLPKPSSTTHPQPSTSQNTVTSLNTIGHTQTSILHHPLPSTSQNTTASPKTITHSQPTISQHPPPTPNSTIHSQPSTSLFDTERPQARRRNRIISTTSVVQESINKQTKCNELLEENNKQNELTINLLKTLITEVRTLTETINKKN